MARLFPILILLAAGGVLTPPPARAHPSDEALLEAVEERAQCERTAAPANPLDAGRLGMSEAELRKAVADLPVAARENATAGGTVTPKRLVRGASGPLARIEYELWGGRVYRIRWQLGAAYERPVLSELARRASICFGRPEYDQTFEAEPGSPVATLRRIGWLHDARAVELRQLHPLRGGPVYLTTSLREVVREMGAAGVAPLPEPDRSAPWWQRSLAPLEPGTDEERARLGHDFVDLLSQLDH